MASAFIGLGSNVGDREGYLRKAISVLASSEGNTVRRASSVYETEPWGKKDQRAFLNQVIELETKLQPRELLILCQEVEKTLGRRNREHWGPRTIDIDILLYDETVVDGKTLCIPHSRLMERRFVLVPLGEIASTVTIPGSGRSVGEVLEECPDRGSVRLYK